MGKLFLLILLVSDPCFSQGQYVQFGAGSSFASTDISAPVPGFSSSFSWGYNFDSGINVESDFEFNYLDFAANNYVKHTFLFSSGLLVGYNLKFLENSTFKFQFGGAVLGFKSILPFSQSSAQTVSYSLISKFGLHFPVSEHLVFFQSVSNNLTASDVLDGLKSGSGKDSYLSFVFGIQYYFNSNRNYISAATAQSSEIYETPLKKDTDSDGIADYKDDCPEIPGTKQNHGCPEEDSDNDGIPNTQDSCQQEPETFNGYLDDDGCPDSVVESRIEIVPEAESQPVQLSVQEHVIPVAPAIETEPKLVLVPSKSVVMQHVSKEFIDLSFPKGSSTFKREQVEPLKAFAGKNKSAKSIVLTIYCWESPVFSENQKVAEKRALNIKKFLVQMGISEKILKIVPVGQKPEKPDAIAGQFYEVETE